MPAKTVSLFPLYVPRLTPYCTITIVYSICVVCKCACVGSSALIWIACVTCGRCVDECETFVSEQGCIEEIVAIARFTTIHSRGAERALRARGSPEFKLTTDQQALESTVDATCCADALTGLHERPQHLLMRTIMCHSQLHVHIRHRFTNRKAVDHQNIFLRIRYHNLQRQDWQYSTVQDQMQSIQLKEYSWN